MIGNAGKASGFAVRTERFRYVEYDGPQGGAMLFDHEDDSHELTSLAEKPEFAAERARLSALIKMKLRR